jgi:hypothetical protein
MVQTLYELWYNNIYGIWYNNYMNYGTIII